MHYNNKDLLAPKAINAWRSVAGLEPSEFTVYYNYGGIHAGHVEARVDMNPVFYVKMSNTEFDYFENEYGLDERAYVKLLEMHKNGITTTTK